MSLISLFFPSSFSPWCIILAIFHLRSVCFLTLFSVVFFLNSSQNSFFISQRQITFLFQLESIHQTGRQMIFPFPQLPYIFHDLWLRHKLINLKFMVWTRGVSFGWQNFMESGSVFFFSQRWSPPTASLRGCVISWHDVIAIIFLSIQ